MNMFKDFLKKNWQYALVLVYILFPIDVIPDSIPLVGNVDDSILLLLSFVKQYTDFKKQKNTGV